jgi:hypothetical protein
LVERYQDSLLAAKAAWCVVECFTGFHESRLFLQILKCYYTYNKNSRAGFEPAFPGVFDLVCLIMASCWYAGESMFHSLRISGDEIL